MDSIAEKISHFVKKYQYALIILMIGIFMMQFPSTASKKHPESEPEKKVISSLSTVEQELENLLGSIRGAGTVRVMLTIGKGSEIIFQENKDISENSSGSEIVTVTDAQRNEIGLIRQTIPEVYRGAVVVCEGADCPEVAYSITEAVSKLTGLGTDRICVIKMQ